MDPHTPGPWRVGDAGHTVFGPPNGTPFPATIATLGKRDEFKANAKLIAAAPDLLAALDALLEAVYTCDRTIDTQVMKAGSLAVAALGKVKGHFIL
jgi:hypothetical protein